MRVSSVLLVVALIAPIVAAQQPSAPQSTLTLRGVVTTANDAPLPRVRIAIARAPATEPPVLTNERGEFALRMPDTESVRVTFTKARYAIVTVDVPRTQFSAAKPAELRVRMSLGGAIGGQVRDRSGVPVMAATVTARRAGAVTSPSPGLTATTNDLGEFRLGNLEAGTYLIAARPPMLSSTVNLTGPDAPPGSEEQTINVTLGGEVNGIDLAIDMPSELRPNTGGKKPADPASASVRGRVVTSQGAPIAGALVQAYLKGMPSELVESDARGRYVITGLAPGDYTVQAFKHGFFALRPGQSQNAVEALLRYQPNNDPVISVRARDVADAADLVLSRGAAIAGTIVDEFGEPMQGVAVNALELRTIAGRTRALRVSVPRGAPARTDDRGRYRLFALQPGAYMVQAVAVDVVTETTGYAPLFYPGTRTIDLAVPTKVDADSAATGIDLTLALGPARRLRGRVLNPAGEIDNLSITMSVSARSAAIQTDTVTARVNADGSFAFDNVAPGEYVVQATGLGRVRGSPGIALSTQFVASYVTVSGDEPPPLTLRLSPGATLMGRVVYEGISSPPPSAVSLVVVPADFDRGPLVRASSAGFALLSDQTFEYRGVWGPSFVASQPRNPDWHVKSITYRGQDLTDSPFDFGFTETFRDIEVVVSGAGAAVTGRVTDERTAPVANGIVVLFPADREKRHIFSRWIKTGRPTQDGAFRVPGLVPGDYWIVAVDRLDGNEVAGDLQNPDFLEALAARAVRITLGEGQTQDLTLRLVRR